MGTIIVAQRDFSGGQINADASHNDDTAMLRSAARQMGNNRILNSRKLQQRPGRRVNYLAAGRTDQVRMSATQIFDLCFTADGVVSVRNSAGTLVFAAAGLPWGPLDTATIYDLSLEVFLNKIYIAGPSMVPRVLSWDGVSAWSIALYAEKISPSGQKRTPFYRISPHGITLAPSGTTGNISILFSAGMNLTNAWLNTRIRYCNKQMTITSIIGALSANATVNETLPPANALAFATDPALIFKVGELVEGSTSGARGQVIIVDGPAKNVMVQLFTSTINNDSSVRAGIPGYTDSQPGSGGTSIITSGFVIGEKMIGGAGSLAITNVATAPPQPVTFWDEEVINNFRGWPASVSIDQSRLAFCDLPSQPNGIIWSAIGTPDDIHIGAIAGEGFFELAPKKCRVYNIIGSGNAAGDQIILTDVGVWFIPVSQSNPLKSGSVTFLPVTNEAAARVRPAVTPEAVLYIGAGLNKVIAIVGTGQQTRPYISREMTDQHYHLLSSPKAIVVANGEGTFPERYILVLNNNGTMMIGRYEGGQKGGEKDFIGWLPWDGIGVPTWISVLGARVAITNNYPTSAGGSSVVETIDDTIYLDGAVLINAVPAALAPAPGFGPLWWLPNGSVELMDGLKPLGTYAVDANGFIIPNNPGEDLSSLTILAGQKYIPTFEPFIPNQEPGQSTRQRMRKRQVKEVNLSVQNSTGFTVEGIAPMQYFRRVPVWNQGENQDAAPPVREDTYTFTPSGAAFDPRLVFKKDMPGPWRIQEFAAEVTT